MTKGQYIRLFLGSDNTTTPAKVIGAAKQLTLHISCTVEVATTKDTVGDWDVQEVTEINYDISSRALVRSGESITSLVNAQGLGDLETLVEDGNPVKWQIANVSGANNRTKGAVICSGSCIISQITIDSQNRQSAEFGATLTGVGPIVVGA